NNLVASAAAGLTINLAWSDNSTNEDGFNIERAPDANGVAGTYVQIAQVGAGVQTYGDAGLQPNVRYWYRVVAYNSVGASPYSNEVSGILATPGAPSGLLASPAAGTSINLTWTDNSSNEQGFNIERAPDANGVAGAYVQIGQVGANVQVYTDAAVQTNTRYWYRVVAYNGIGP